MTIAQLDIVRALAVLPPPAPLAALTDRLDCHADHIDNGMRKLVRQGFVDRVRTGDGIMRYRLTEAGKKLSSDGDDAARARVVVLVRRQLEHAPRPLTNGDIATALDHAVSKRQITFALNTLKHQGVAVKFGDRSGTTWTHAARAEASNA